MRTLWKKSVYWFKCRTQPNKITVSVNTKSVKSKTFHCVHIFNHGYLVGIIDLKYKPTKKTLDRFIELYAAKDHLPCLLIH